VDDRSIGEELVGWGKVALIETTGRVSGVPFSAAVGFVEDDDGSLLIAAGGETADWALNLRAHPTCRVTIGERVTGCHASEVEGADRARALAGLVLKYGTPAERLGHGPVFRLVPQA
jgi:deazaflavin-dependent oxidoreductase (nitroreductase family)